MAEERQHPIVRIGGHDARLGTERADERRELVERCRERFGGRAHFYLRTWGPCGVRTRASRVRTLANTS